MVSVGDFHHGTSANKENRIGSVWWSSLAKAIDGWWTRFHFRLWLEKALSRGLVERCVVRCFFSSTIDVFFPCGNWTIAVDSAAAAGVGGINGANENAKSFFVWKKNERQDRYSFTSLNQKSERRFSLFPSSLSNQMSIKVRSCWKLRWKSSLIKETW